MEPDPALCEPSKRSQESDNTEKHSKFSKVGLTCSKLPLLSITRSSTELPYFLNNLFTNGPKEPVNFRASFDDRPDWLDLEKFKRGQKFGRDNLICLGFAELFATFMVWALDIVLLPFVFAGSINTPFKSMRRYASTFLKINSWYEKDIWVKETNIGKINLQAVKSYHQNFHLKVSSSSSEEIAEKIGLKEEMNLSFNFLVKEVSKTVQSSCPVNFKTDYSEFGINQLNMSLMQFTLVGLAVTYPQEFGLYYATEEDLEALIHTWRGLGYLLGVTDEYNFCNCDLETFRRRTKDLIELVIKPSFTNLSEEWEYVFRSTADSAEFYSAKGEYESYMLYLLEILKINSDSLRRRVSYYQIFYFYTMKFFFGFLVKIPYLLKLINKIVVRGAMKSLNLEEEILKKIKAKNYEYVKKNK